MPASHPLHRIRRSLLRPDCEAIMPLSRRSETLKADDFSVTAHGSLFVAIAAMPLVLISGALTHQATLLIGSAMAAGHATAAAYRRVRIRQPRALPAS